MTLAITKENLTKSIGVGLTSAANWVNPLLAVVVKYNISTNIRFNYFLANVAHECSRFSILEENLNYSSILLLKDFPSHFDSASASKYANNPKMIGNLIYANRMGNGNESSGDGYNFRGRGCIQITGKSMYADCGKALGLDLLTHPELLLQPINAIMSAGWFWDTHKLNLLADKGDMNSITKKINGGLNGLSDRIALLKSCKKIFK